jgi:hypothetical protein
LALLLLRRLTSFGLVWHAPKVFQKTATSEQQQLPLCEHVLPYNLIVNSPRYLNPYQLQKQNREATAQQQACPSSTVARTAAVAPRLKRPVLITARDQTQMMNENCTKDSVGSNKLCFPLIVLRNEVGRNVPRPERMLNVLHIKASQSKPKLEPWVTLTVPACFDLCSTSTPQALGLPAAGVQLNNHI